MENKIEDMLAVPITLTDNLRKAADEADSYKQECADLKKQVEKLAYLLRAVARVSSDGSGRLYKRPTGRIMQELEKSLNKALTLVRKCSKNGCLKRMITITSVSDFKRVMGLLENGIGDIKWLLNVSASGEERADYFGLPPIASTDPMLAFIWDHIALLQRGSEEEREDAANNLASAAKDNDRNGKIIVEEEGVPPLLKLLSDGTPTARETAARAIGYLARDRDRVKQIVADGAVPVFVKVLTDAPMRVQAKVAWALAKMLSHDPDAQEDFHQHGVIKPLVSLLAFETLAEPSRMDNRTVSMHSLVETSIAATKAGTFNPGKPGHEPKSTQVNLDDTKNHQNVTGEKKLVRITNNRGLTSWELSRKEREKEDPQVKTELKTETARALWKLAKGNPRTTKSITETRALLCCAKLMEVGRGELQRYALMAVVEMVAVTENDPDLRRAAFKTSSPAAKAVVEQLLRLVEDGEPYLQVPSIKAIGCLSRTFPARETRVLKPLVKQLEGFDGREEVVTEAVVALVKFASTENYLHQEHSKYILEGSGASHLVQLIYFAQGQPKVSAIILMCYLALHVGESDSLAKAEALPALEWVAKSASLMQDPTVQQLLPHAIAKLEIYQGKGMTHSSVLHSPDHFHHLHF